MPIYGQGKIGRNVTVSHCFGQSVIYDDNHEAIFEDFTFDIYGCYTPQRATRYARQKFGDSTITINHVEHETGYYAMKLSDFMRYAERTSNNGEERNC